MASRQTFEGSTAVSGGIQAFGNTGNTSVINNSGTTSHIGQQNASGAHGNTVNYVQVFLASKRDSIAAAEQACPRSTSEQLGLLRAIRSFRATLQETEDAFGSEAPSPQVAQKLHEIVTSCSEVLVDLESFTTTFQSWDTQLQRSWTRLDGSKETVQGLEARLNGCADSLVNFHDTFGRLEEKLATLVRELQSGKREGSIASRQTIEQLSQEDGWRTLCRELEDVGIPELTLIEKRPYIVQWFKDAAHNGLLDELALRSESSADTSLSRHQSLKVMSKESASSCSNTERQDEADERLYDKVELPEEQQPGLRFANRLQYMHSHLKRNICQLAHGGVKASEIHFEIRQEHIPLELMDACTQWAVELLDLFKDSNKVDHSAILQKVLRFLQTHLLHWLELLSIVGTYKDGLSQLGQFYYSKHVELQDFADDAFRFAFYNQSVISTAPLQVYCSALLFTPTSSLVRTCFEEDEPDWVTVKPQVEQLWSPIVYSLSPAISAITCIDISVAAGQIAVGYQKHTITLWDLITMRYICDFGPQFGAINSVSFSESGQRLVSSSADGSIRIWSTTTKRLLYGTNIPFTLSAAFSSESQILLLATNRVRLGQGTTGPVLEIYRDMFTSTTAALSADGQQLAFKTLDNHIAIWNSDLSSQASLILPHEVSRFTLASVSNGGTWCVFTRPELKSSETYLWHRPSSVMMVALPNSSHSCRPIFSANGEQIAFGLVGGRVVLFSIPSRKVVNTISFGTNTSNVTCLAFTPNAAHIICGFENGGLQVREANAHSVPSSRQKHLATPSSIGYLPEKSQFYSISFPDTYLWDSNSGKWMGMQNQGLMRSILPAFKKPLKSKDFKVVENVVLYRSRPIIFLPRDTQSKIVAGEGNKLAIGSGDGSVTILGFDMDQLARIIPES